MAARCEAFDARLRASVSDLVKDLRQAVGEQRPAWLAGAALVLAVFAVFAEAIFSPRRLLRARHPRLLVSPSRRRSTRGARRALASALESLRRLRRAAASPTRAPSSPIPRPGSPCCCRPRSTTSSSRSATRCWRRRAPGRWRAAWAWDARPRRSPARATRSRARSCRRSISSTTTTGAAWIPWVLWALEGLLRGPGVRAALTAGARGRRPRSWPARGTCVSPPRCSASPRIAWRLAAPSTSRAERSACASRGTGRSPRCWPWRSARCSGSPPPSWSGAARAPSMDLRTASYWSLHPASLADLAVPRLVSDLPLSTASRAALFEGRGPLLACIYLGVVPLALRPAGARPALAARPPGTALGALAPRAAEPGPPHAALLAVLEAAGLRPPALPAEAADPGRALRRPARRARSFGLGASLVARPSAAAGAGRRPCSSAARSSSRRSRHGWRARPAGWRRASTRRVPLWPRRHGSDAEAAARLAAGGARGAPAAGPCAERARRLARGARAPRCWARPTACWSGAASMASLPAALFEHRPAAVARAERADAHPRDAPNRRASSPAGIPPAGSPSGSGPGRAGHAATAVRSALWSLRKLRRRVHAASARATRAAHRERLESAGHAGRTAAAAARERRPRVPRRQERPGRARPARDAAVSLRLPAPRPAACRIRCRAPTSSARNGERSERRRRSTPCSNPTFDPTRDVVLEVAPVSVRGAGPVGADDVRIVARTTNTLELRARLASPGTLVVVEAYDPNWRAEVDARRATLLRANGLFRAVRLASGEHRVRFAYRPWSLPVGALLQCRRASSPRSRSRGRRARARSGAVRRSAVSGERARDQVADLASSSSPSCRRPCS